MFVSKGRVSLTVAVDRLAEARRTADQTNEDGRNAAKVELRAEFYSASSLTTIIDPGTGKTHTIFPERWGLEEALTWLERGECLLTSGLVYPRLGLSFNKDPTVSIFMDEDDLQRLIAKQEVKQEAAPAERQLQPEGTSETATPKMRGRKKGDGSYAAIDLPLLDEMKELISSHRAASPEEAANAGGEGIWLWHLGKQDRAAGKTIQETRAGLIRSEAGS
ncbi:hypothetical protein KIP88_35130 [Bradyrhizobium sp. SRL28]|uniref:hypothetical protein n=1 Tax=Bradyrhizobium sp. SRL28 TaxID=2836178 RepID=UPI001BDDDF6D|nr:hypothetical protein [Bradyrhizobium sp. SRL28]MBT1515715.1 hypothetical protein [Bradyrhizobium sp. SRL28]